MEPRIIRIDNIQIAATEGCEEAARQFYGSILGLQEIEKPSTLSARGGCWFQCVDRSFQPAKKAHPAFACPRLDQLRGLLRARGVTVVDDDALPGTRRFYAEDPWGNRLEFLEVQP